MKLRSLSLSLALITVAAPALAKGQTDAQAAPPPASAAPSSPGTAAPSTEPSGTAEGPAGGANVTLSNNPVKDTASSEGQQSEAEKKESTLPFRGSTFVFDQSMTTQTAHLDTNPQLSYIPLYEWWLSFRPRWYFNEHIYVWARFDYTKEFTNNQDTTRYRQDLFGDIWTDLRYTSKVPAINKNFKATAGIRAKWPTSIESQGNGVYVTTGLTGTAQQKIPINGENANFLNEAELSLNLTYEHPWSRATTPTNPNLNYIRQDTEGRSFISDQLRGTPLVNHNFLAALHGGLLITPKLATSLDMIFINSWHYHAPGDVTVPVAGGDAFVPRSSNDTIFTQRTWLIANVEYELIDEVSLGLGYYNLASVIAPNGVRRSVVGGDNVLWSPDARVFFDVTVNLDKFYEWAGGARRRNDRAAGGTPTQRNAQRVQSF